MTTMTKFSGVELYPILSLAYMGDCVYEMYVRSKLIADEVADLHKEAVGFVNANAQYEAAVRLLPLLDEREMAIFKRGRNAKINNCPKNAKLAHYKYATGLEAVVGYLYLSGDIERLDCIMGECLRADCRFWD